jgi:serine/threonine protein kinase
MREIRGESLKELLEKRASGRPAEAIDSTDKILRIILKVCDGLAYAHSKGKLHQDIKPENIMIGEFGEVFVIDWGSSSVSDKEEYIQVTPGYMSPEQAIGDNTTHATDIYSVGVTLFHLLYDRLPTQAKNMERMVDKKVKELSIYLQRLRKKESLHLWRRLYLKHLLLNKVNVTKQFKN